MIFIEEFKTVPPNLPDEERLKEARNQLMIGNDNPFGLSEKRKAFADYYMYSGDKVISRIRAGFSNDGHINTVVLQDPDVKLYLRLLQEMADGVDVADTDEVLSFLTRVMRGEVFEPTKLGTGKGVEKIEYIPPNISERIRAGELLGRRYRVFNSDIDVTLNAPIFTGVDEVEE